MTELAKVLREWAETQAKKLDSKKDDRISQSPERMGCELQ